MISFDGQWTGQIVGTNNGDIYLEIVQQDSILSCNLYINDYQGIAYGFLGKGKVEQNKAIITITPKNSSLLGSLSKGEVEASLNSDGILNGSWKTEIGTAGAFTAKRVNLQEETELKDTSKISIAANSPRCNFDKTKVFIVHGHDDLAKTECARFIEQIGFKPIILQEQMSSGQTIVEKLENYSNVGFGIILYTPCDIGAKSRQELNLRPRVRQNVVFEHGFLIGKLGRHNVCALVKEEVERPTDISGIVYVTMDTYGAWKNILAKEMKNSGYDVDMNKLI